MATKKPISWFLTANGRTFSFYTVTGLGISFASLKFVPNTFLISQFKDFVHYYENGQPAELPTQLQTRFEKCLDMLNLAPIHKKLLSAFSATGFDLWNAGSCKTKYGALVGIPRHFAYNTMEDLKIDQDKIKVNQKSVNWDSEVGKKLGNSLILSEKVQEFAICREILTTQNFKLHLQSIYPFASMLFAFTVSQKINQKLNLYAVARGVRVIMYSLTGIFGIGLYYLLNDYTEVFYETLTDKKLCELGKDYIEAGVVFYDKLLQRNQALRELLGNKGEGLYSVKGNELFGLRQPRIALVHRKAFFESQLKGKGDKELIEDGQVLTDVA